MMAITLNRRGVAGNAQIMRDTSTPYDAGLIETTMGVARNAPTNHCRRTVRLKGYDYAQNGLYFLTICVQNRKCLFGNIRNGLVMLNYAGKIAEYELIETPKHRDYLVLHEYIIMPNHIHMIMEITDCDDDTRNDPPSDQTMSAISPKHGTLSVIVRAYKSAVSHKLGYSPWQRNYYEHIIRNEQSYEKIAEYIRCNPERWQMDKLYINEL